MRFLLLFQLQIISNSNDKFNENFNVVLGFVAVDAISCCSDELHSVTYAGDHVA